MSNPKRSEVAVTDTWDLSSLFANDEAWAAALPQFEACIEVFQGFAGTLGRSPEQLAACLDHDVKTDLIAERIGTYAFLKTAEDQGNSQYQGFAARYQNLASRVGQAASFIRPEILAIPGETMTKWLEHPALAPYRLVIQRIHRYRAHTLDQSQERLLAMQSEMAQTASKTFRQLNDADLKFGSLSDEEGNVIELTNASFSGLLQSPDREVRSKAFHQYYSQFVAHENTLASTLAGSVHTDVYYSRARNYPSALESSLFADNVPVAVYDNLIAAVRNHLPAVHAYFDMRRRKMKLDTIHHYDTYVPILSESKTHRTWDQAVEIVMESLKPLGHEYCRVLAGGLRGRWCDRYPNAGKQSGAFSCGTFSADPYILMNYKTDVLNDVFTLTHEAGHSMHSYYSAASQPFQYYNYTIFVAEVASTFNEQLLARTLIERASSPQEKASIINHEIDSIRATIVRQTMFAEFERDTHAGEESGRALTLDSLRKTYRALLDAYFGPRFSLDDELELECLRIPHFYSAFYVYKYATGLSAAVALAKQILKSGDAGKYLGFLSSGGSKFPVETLREAGVDMADPAPVQATLDLFARRVAELKTLLPQLAETAA